MKQAIGSVFLYNIIIVFIILVFAFLAASVSYSKAFRVNSRIAGYIEKYEGYNTAAINNINKDLNTIGYRRGSNKNCASKRDDGVLQANGENQYKYCVYRYVIDKRHYAYGILTYIDIDIPVISKTLELPVFSRTSKVYRFGTR